MGDKNKWVGTFSVSPTNLILTNIQFKNETILVKLNITISGNFLRIKFSNLYGETTLKIKEAWIYTHDLLTYKKCTRILFNKNSELNIPKNQEIYSDIFELHIDSSKDLWIGFYLEEFTELSTGNFTNSGYYISEKNNILDKFKKIQKKNSVYKHEYKNHIIPFITNIDVLSKDNFFSIVSFGDSSTGYNWAEYLKNLFKDNNIENISVLSQEINGNRLTHDSIDLLKGLYGISGLSRFEHDVLKQPGIKFVIISIGVNDLILPYKNFQTTDKISTKDITDSFKICIERAKEKEVKIIGVTIPPFYGFKYFSNELETIRNEVNYWIRTYEEFEYVIDFDKLLRDSDNHKKLNALFDNGDHFHINESGIKFITDSIDLKIFLGK